MVFTKKAFFTQFFSSIPSHPEDAKYVFFTKYKLFVCLFVCLAFHFFTAHSFPYLAQVRGLTIPAIRWFPTHSCAFPHVGSLTKGHPPAPQHCCVTAPLHPLAHGATHHCSLYCLLRLFHVVPSCLQH